MVNNDLEESNEEFLSALGCTDITRVDVPSKADFGFIRYKDSFMLFTFGKYDAAVSAAIENGASPISDVLCSVFPESDILAVVLQGSTDLAGFSLYTNGEHVRRWAAAADHGTLVDEGDTLESEAQAAKERLANEEVVHAVTVSVMEFDLIDVFHARDAGEVEEFLFSVSVSDA
ncbi:hypothetical protein [Ideonella sp.]|uniref:hypothetical protein n=1 Tax=Ideonella sp. TaxID=1929293 RepID=UPI0037BFCA52